MQQSSPRDQAPRASKWTRAEGQRRRPAIKSPAEAQEDLLQTLGFPVVLENLDDAELTRIEDALSNEIQTHSINETSNGLNDYGELYRSCIIALPD